jgi:small subunit ribosomal protein S8
MAQSHPLSDMLTRIRNGLARHKATVQVSASKQNKNVLNVLTDQGYIRGFVEEKDERGHPVLRVDLKYTEGEAAIRELKTVSKPGRRVYASVKTMPRVHNGLGASIVTTPKGVMTDSKARSENVGGEVLCQVF